MKIQTNNLKDKALDWAVATCEGKGFAIQRPDLLARGIVAPLPYSTNCAYSWPIIDRERIGVTPITVTVGDDRGKREWFANHEDKADFQDGPTSLIAAMRCYVASKLGDEVDVPDELGASK